jgi:hypothetical protein
MQLGKVRPPLFLTRFAMLKIDRLGDSEAAQQRIDAADAEDMTSAASH